MNEQTQDESRALIAILNALESVPDAAKFRIIRYLNERWDVYTEAPPGGGGKVQ